MKFNFDNPGCEGCRKMLRKPFSTQHPYDQAWHDCGSPHWYLARMRGLLATYYRYRIGKSVKLARKQLRIKFINL